MDRFIKELMVGDIHLRDKWQIELKSEFAPLSDKLTNTFTQEFYLFIPNSLHINEETYSKEQFYLDRTLLIRYKTPEFSLHELCDPQNSYSPLTKLHHLLKCEKTFEIFSKIEDELKLLGNIFRSAVREDVKAIINNARSNLSIEENTQKLCQDIESFRKDFILRENAFLNDWNVEHINHCFFYIDEFISTSINYYLTGLLSEIRIRLPDVSKQTTDPVCLILETERQHRKKHLQEPSITDEDSISNEYILYRNSLLNKYILDTLLLKTSGGTIKNRFRNLIGSLSAGIAMLFFFVLYVFQGQVFIINSLPFILLTVILYILKDRIKEWLKASSYKQFSRWFYDYSTDILSADDSTRLGKLNESISFINEDEISEDIEQIRNREFHNVLEKIKRPEQVIYYKKELTIYNKKVKEDSRKQAINLIFRFNINRFLNKADNPTHDYLKIDPESFKFIRAKLPKVYHINIILKLSYFDKNRRQVVELKKFRLVIDKNGIKRIEHPILKQNG